MQGASKGIEDSRANVSLVALWRSSEPEINPEAATLTPTRLCAADRPCVARPPRR
jgi:hypothetical protein